MLVCICVCVFCMNEGFNNLAGKKRRRRQFLEKALFFFSQFLSGMWTHGTHGTIGKKEG